MDVQMFQRHRAALFPLGKHLVHLFFALDPDKGMTKCILLWLQIACFMITW